MADNIVIKFDVDNSALVSTIDLLEKIGAVDKQTADAFRKSTADYEARKKAIADLSTTQKANTEVTKQSVAGINELSTATKSLATNITNSGIEGFAQEIQAGITDALGEAGVSTEEFLQKMNEAGISLNIFEGIESKTSGTTSSLRAQLRQAKEELSKMEQAGLEGTQAFDELSIHAARLEDQIGDTQQRIRALASDNFKFDAINSGLQGLVGGFSAAQGAAALFGDDNKELQETLVKLNALIAISTGLAQVKATLEKQSAFVQAIRIGQTKLETVQTSLNTAAESSNVAVKYAAIAAQKALNAVQALSPAGALALAVGALTLAYTALSSKTESAVEQQIKLNDAQRASLEAVKFQDEAIRKVSEARVADLEKQKQIAESEGKSKSFLRELDRRIDNERLIASQLRVDANRRNVNEIIKNEEGFLQKIEKQKDLLVDLEKKKAEGAKFYTDAVTNQRIPIEKAIEVTRNYVENQISAFELAKSALEASLKAEADAIANANARAKQEQLELLNNEKATADARVIIAKSGTSERLKAEAAAIEAEKKLALQNATSPEQKALIEIQAAQKISEKRIEFANRELAAQIENEQIKLLTVQKDSESELALKIRILEQQRQLELNNINLTSEERKNVNAKADAEIANLRRQFEIAERERELEFNQQNIALKLAIVQEGSAQELQLKKDAIDAQVTADIEAAQRTILVEENLQAQIKLIREKSVADKKKLDADSANATINQISNQLSVELSLANKKLELKKAQTTDPDEILAIERQITNNELLEIENRRTALEKKLASGIISYEEYTNEINDIDSDATDIQIKNAQRAAAEQEKINNHLKAAAFQLAQEISDAYFASGTRRRKEELDAELSKIETEREAELGKLEKLTAAERREREKQKAINDKFDREANAVKLETAKKQRSADVTQAIVNGFMAASRAFADYQYPYSLIIAALAAFQTAIQVQNIKSQPLPTYFKGTEYLQRGNNPAGRDTIHVMANEGERIIPTDINLEYFPALSAIQKRKIPADYANLALASDKFSSSLPQQQKVNQEIMRMALGYNIAASIKGSVNSDEVAKIVSGELKKHLNDVYWKHQELVDVMGVVAENTAANQNHFYANPYRA